MIKALTVARSSCIVFVVSAVAGLGCAASPRVPSNVRIAATSTKASPTGSLAEAARRNDLIAATELLRAGADVHARNPEGYTALMIAAGLGGVQMVELLLSSDLAEVRTLLAAGSRVDERAPMAGTIDDGYTPLGVAARDGRADIVRELLQAGADPRRVDGMMKATPGHKAGYMGRADAARALVEHRAANRATGRVLELDAQGPYNGFTALHDAVWHGHTETVRVLIEAGARTDLRTHGGLTPLELAEYYEYRDIAEILRPR